MVINMSSPLSRKIPQYAITLVLCVFIGISFWVFSRFTVDDAFITWRYGKNLLETGIWNYNPSSFDLTQAYTNPIYAIISIIPAFLSVDVVLFFKILSLAFLLTFSCWYTKKLNNSLAVILFLLFLALPATFIHAFSGLETFLYASLLTILLIFLYEEKFYPAIITTLLLFITRPESWVLVVMVPAYFLIQTESIRFSEKTGHSSSALSWFFARTTLAKSLQAGLLLAIPLAIYFGFHYAHFGNMLPNTFYIKSVAPFSFSKAGWFALLGSPVTALLLVRRYKLFLFTSLFIGAMIISYSKSVLTMNYCERFSFHIFAPAYLFTLFIYTRQQVDTVRGGISKPTMIILLLLASFIPFAKKTTNENELTFISVFYPRVLEAHAALGKTLHDIAAKYQLHTLAMADAGLTPYHSGLSTLDTIGLGSHAVAMNHGVTPALLDKYHPDIIILRTNKKGMRINTTERESGPLDTWAKQHDMHVQCEVYWTPDYKLGISTRKDYPELAELCTRSKAFNNKSDKAFFQDSIHNSPWSYWKE